MDLQPLAPAVLAVATDDVDLLDRLLSITAAVGIEPLVVNDAQLLRPVWGSAAMVLIGADQAPRAVALGLRRRAEVYVLSTDGAPADAFRWAMPLGAAVVTLPESADWLAGAIADRGARRTAAGRLVCVVGGSGGVGASTLAAGLAFVAARSLRTSLLVDADGRGGGLDLLLGAERMDGLRWPRLAGIRGQIGDLSGQVPRVDGVDLLAMGRTETASSWTLGRDQLSAVLESAARSHQITVVDLPRSADVADWDVLEQADLIAVVVAADVRGVAAARSVQRRLPGDRDQLGVVVRGGRARTLTAQTVADGLGVRLLGELAEDPSMAAAAERGDPPGRSRKGLAQVAQQVLDQLDQLDELAEASPAWA